MYYLFKYEAVIETNSNDPVLRSREDICGMKLVSVRSRHYPSNGNKESLAQAIYKLKVSIAAEEKAKVISLKIVEDLTIH